MDVGGIGEVVNGWSMSQMNTHHKTELLEVGQLAVNRAGRHIRMVDLQSSDELLGRDMSSCGGEGTGKSPARTRDPASLSS